jgi:hypothetical protein
MTISKLRFTRGNACFKLRFELYWFPIQCIVLSIMNLQLDMKMIKPILYRYMFYPKYLSGQEMCDFRTSTEFERRLSVMILENIFFCLYFS